MFFSLDPLEDILDILEVGNFYNKILNLICKFVKATTPQLFRKTLMRTRPNLRCRQVPRKPSTPTTVPWLVSDHINNIFHLHKLKVFTCLLSSRWRRSLVPYWLDSSRFSFWTCFYWCKNFYSIRSWKNINLDSNVMMTNKALGYEITFVISLLLWTFDNVLFD